MVKPKTELYKHYRPEEFEHVRGQDTAVAQLTGWVKRKAVPHTLLFTGMSGCGKTTLARILRRKIGCGDIDFHEINCAEARGIDMVREIKGRMGIAPMAGRCRVWLLDEFHKTTNDAQNAFLKILEDTPNHVYFFLATTDPQKIIKTVLTRCNRVALEPVDKEELTALVAQVAADVEFELSEDVAAKIVDCADGSARQALQFLNSILDIDNEEEQLETIAKGDAKQDAIVLCRIMFGKAPTWAAVCKVLQTIDPDQAESVRCMILSYATSILLKSQNKRAALVIDIFRRNYFDSKKAGLVADCFEVCTTK